MKSFFKTSPLMRTCCLLPLLVIMLMCSLKANDSIAVINYNQVVRQSDCIVVGTLKEKIAPSYVQKTYVISATQRLKGDLKDPSVLVVPINVDSSEGSPPAIQDDKEYLLFLENTSDVLHVLAGKSAYKLTANWKGIMPTGGAGSENRAAANVLKYYSVNPYDDFQAFIDAIRYAISPENKMDLSANAQKIIDALGIRADIKLHSR